MKRKESRTWILVVLLGILMILAAALLCVHNFRESRDAEDYAETVLETLKQNIPEPPAESRPDIADIAPVPEEDLFAPYEAAEEDSPRPSDIVIGNAAYCGYLSVPALGLELPVLSSWSYPDLKKTPCRYSGSVQTNDLIIAAHNYDSHFGRIGTLTAGDAILFTDTAGTVHEFAVSFMEIIGGQDVAQMFSGQSEDWDLTLFTCTLSGQSRVTVRADRIRQNGTGSAAE
ncbi:MAG: sortase [Oscillospiraceae bacterium]|nr:sortase [Oscillospiraceae bacterium]